MLWVLAPIVLALLWLAMLGPGGAPDPVGRSGCSGACSMVYDPVACVFADGDARGFGSRCEAERYACEHRTRLVRCDREVR
ncbi:hypothetical protein [Actinomadura parmotrematis]|uniref:Kazal-like domain-containing protein n=1 Tax=Actinomadura parmotrematis TaxID=2864039 RepID=A0ABS7FMV6_9ACTN|nr:hypothetical protein [Actinomadura parmotrematis]MBW8481089.1 hypothetical protein [Actinomadura parmotrematis]